MPTNPPDLPPPSPGNSARHDPTVGRRLGSYEVLARVARGGMGVVYRARHVYIDKIVALKVLDPVLAARKDFIERFRTEAQSLAKVEHENVVKVIDVQEFEGVHFIVMDFVEGVNLRTMVKERGPLPAKELLSVARQTADAMLFAHKMGVLHRDIKPENIIMSSRGVCKLTDFGLAGDLRLISEGREGPLNFGTPAYSAPEVLRRQTPDARSDIFSFGATIYQLAAGETPFGPNNAQQIALKQRQGAELLDGRRPDLPQSMCALIHSCIAYNPAERPLDFEEILQRLPKRILQHATPDTPTAPSGPLTTTESLPPRVSNRSAALAAGGIAVLVVLIVGFIAISKLFGGDQNRAPVENTPQDGVSVANVPAANHLRDGSHPDGGHSDVVKDTPPKDGKPPAFTADEEAFNQAELASIGSMRSSDYARAYLAWTEFLNVHPNSPSAQQAVNKRDDVVSQVALLRKQAFDNALAAAAKALNEGRTGDALAQWESLPSALLTPLFDGEVVELVGRVDEQKRRAQKAEDDALIVATNDADKLHGKGELLAEKVLLENFQTGRSKATRDKVATRLTTLVTRLATAHLEAGKALAADRDAATGRRGQLALDIKGGIEQLGVDVLNRRWAKARQGLAVLARDLPDSVLRAQVDRYLAELDLAGKGDETIHNALDKLRRRGAVTEIKVHSAFMDDGSRDGRIDTYTGKITGVTDTEMTLVLNSGAEQKLKVGLIYSATVRSLLKDGSIDERLILVAWLLAVGKAQEAQGEADRLAATPALPSSVKDRVEVLRHEDVLGQLVLRRLAFFAARGGRLSREEFVTLFGSDGPDVALLDLQKKIADGDVAAARSYLAAARATTDIETISPPLIADCVTLVAADATRADFELWVKLEPRNTDAWLALSRAQKKDGLAPNSRQSAQKALDLDASLEEAQKLSK